jgi:hypothetical protein
LDIPTRTFRKGFNRDYATDKKISKAMRVRRIICNLQCPALKKRGIQCPKVEEVI